MPPVPLSFGELGRKASALCDSRMKECVRDEEVLLLKNICEAILALHWEKVLFGRKSKENKPLWWGLRLSITEFLVGMYKEMTRQCGIWETPLH